MAASANRRRRTEYDLLVEKGLVSEDDLDEARRIEAEGGRSVEEMLTEDRAVSKSDLLASYSRYSSFEPYDIGEFGPAAERAAEVIREIDPPTAAMRHQQFCPIDITDEGTVLILLGRPGDLFTRDDICMRLPGRRIEFRVALRSEIDALIREIDDLPEPAPLPDPSPMPEAAEPPPAYTGMPVNLLTEWHARTGWASTPPPPPPQSRGDREEFADEVSVEDAPVIKLVNLILMEAVKHGHREIHIWPGPDGVNVSMRVGSKWQPKLKIPRRMRQPVTNRIKIIANLDITRRQKPQNGWFRIRCVDRQTLVRVGTLPMGDGAEAVAIQLKVEPAGPRRDSILIGG